jgi:hypothetical protein
MVLHIMTDVSDNMASRQAESDVGIHVRSKGHPLDGQSLSERNGYAKLSPVAWMPSRDLEYSNWVLEGRRIGLIGKGSPWWIGDWLNYGTTKWGERYVEAVKITGYDAKSLRNMRYVASRFDLSLRRDKLMWSHHALLAAMEPDEQRHWLDLALANRFSIEDLRLELRAAHRGGYAAALHDKPSTGAGRDNETLVCPQCGYKLTPQSQQRKV